MKYADKRKLRLVPYTYGQLRGIPPGERWRLPPPRPWDGRYHRWAESYWLARQYVAEL